MNPLIITAALVGAELNREMQPYLPVTPDEIAQSGIEAVQAGAAVLHLHVRDSEQKPSCDEKIFKEVIQMIRERCSSSPKPSPQKGEGNIDPIIQVSTGGAIGDSEDDRLRPLQAGSEMASLTTGSVNFGHEVFLNPIPFIEKLARSMQQRKIKPEIEVFDVSMLEMGIRLIEKGLIETPAHFQFVLGVPGALGATERNLKFLLEGLPPDSTWTLAAIGRHQFSMMDLAIRWGGNVRVGFEDNIYLEKGALAKTNAELVAKVAALAKIQGRAVATIEEARGILHLN